MTRNEIEVWFKKWLEESFVIQPSRGFSEDLSIMNDLGFDSLDCIDLHMSAEERFDIVAMDNEVEKLSTVKDLIAFIEAKLKEKEKQA